MTQVAGLLVFAWYFAVHYQHYMCCVESHLPLLESTHHAHAGAPIDSPPYVFPLHNVAQNSRLQNCTFFIVEFRHDGWQKHANTLHCTQEHEHSCRPTARRAARHGKYDALVFSRSVRSPRVGGSHVLLLIKCTLVAQSCSVITPLHVLPAFGAFAGMLLCTCRAKAVARVHLFPLHFEIFQRSTTK